MSSLNYDIGVSDGLSNVSDVSHSVLKSYFEVDETSYGETSVTMKNICVKHALD